MERVTVVIPNYNGREYLEDCLNSLQGQGCKILVVDNASQDKSVVYIQNHWPQVRLICLDQNYGFCRAVNEGIRAADTEYVFLLNNDTKVKKEAIDYLVADMDNDRTMFSCQAKMLQMDMPELVDSAGDTYCALGWARSRGKDHLDLRYEDYMEVFSTCAGAALYRKSLFEKIGYFDEAHFAYLEDVDIGYRARIAGYRNFCDPRAIVLHKGSAVTGSRHNRFKVRKAACNNLYLIYKNMPRWQILINLPFLIAGCVIKFFYFGLRRMGISYLKGLREGVRLSKEGEKVGFLQENFDNCWKIQLELWKNIFPGLRKNQ